MTRICVLAVALLLRAAPLFGQTPESSCIACHGDSDLVDEASAKLVASFQQGVHQEVGLSCTDCHGGNPDPALADDADAAMDEGFAADPFRGAPARGDIPGACGRCHSDPDYMKQYRPEARVDQETEYWTSQHGRLLRNGDPKVATCVDCHGVHGIIRPADPRSPVYPTKIAETCRGCHGDAKRMAGYTLPDGRPLPVDQYSRWRRSVHAAAMFEKEDLTAPTCNDCHGNHGATPPGLQSIAFVCGQCHGREADLFRNSPKHQGFLDHHDYLEEAGSEGCVSCHEPETGKPARRAPHGFFECNSCHGNHAIVRPTVAMLAPLPDAPCAFCHEPLPSEAEAAAEREASRQKYQEMKASLESTAEAQGLTGEARFDWLVDQALTLPTHTQISEGAEGKAELRPEFARLFQKFRIGKTYFTYDDPVSGEPTQARVVRCTDCHVSGGESTSAAAARTFVDKMRELTSMTAQAERTLLFARRGGVETRDAMSDLDQAVDAQIELEVLVHTFSADAGGKFLEKHDAGLAHARTAFEKGQESLVELSHRRRGLVVALVILCILVVGLGLRIRQLGT